MNLVYSAPLTEAGLPNYFSFSQLRLSDHGMVAVVFVFFF